MFINRIDDGAQIALAPDGVVNVYPIAGNQAVNYKTKSKHENYIFDNPYVFIQFFC